MRLTKFDIATVVIMTESLLDVLMYPRILSKFSKSISPLLRHFDSIAAMGFVSQIQEKSPVIFEFQTANAFDM